MNIKKLEHSGIEIEKDEKCLVIDPVEFEEKLPEFKNVVAIIITHKHGDHLQVDNIDKILANNPNAQIFTTKDALDLLPNATAVSAGDSFEVGGFRLRFYGKNHASIIAGQIPCENIGVIIDEKIVDPGDSFDLPDMRPEILFVPIAAPWCKVSESIDFMKKAMPKVVIPFHDAVLSEIGKGFNYNWLKMACEETGVKFAGLNIKEILEF